VSSALPAPGFSLDSVVAAFDQGATAEEIVQRYPSLDVISVYEVIAYVLRHRGTVDEYLAKRSEQSGLLQSEVERRFPPHGIRERLMARRAQGAAGSR
jgi:hypothetical protein